jgi:hypothetical protein
MDGAGDRRFDLMEKDETIFIDDALAVMGVVDPPQPGDKIAPVTLTATSTLHVAGSLMFSNSVGRFASRYYEIPVDAAVNNVQVQFSATGLTGGLCQIVLIDEDMNLRNVYRSDAISYTKQFANLIAGKHLLKIVLVASGTDASGSFTIGVSAVSAAPNVMVTRWNSQLGNEYEIDSRLWSWTWVSPDIWVDNDGDGNADGDVFFNQNNQLFIRLHNQGNADASGISVEFYYQDGSGGLSSGAWMPVVDTGATTQTLTGLSLMAGTSNQWSVNWSPSPSGSSHHFCVRAIVTVPGDPNTDNKRVLSNFGNVHVQYGGFGNLILVRRNVFDVQKNVKLAIVPRLPPELKVANIDLLGKADVQLAPGEMVRDSIRVQHRPGARKPIPPITEHIKERRACTPVIVRTTPDPSGHYPLDRKALPPGLAGKPMITLVHLADGIPLGGMTYMLTVDKKEE